MKAAADMGRVLILVSEQGPVDLFDAQIVALLFMLGGGGVNWRPGQLALLTVVKLCGDAWPCLKKGCERKGCTGNTAALDESRLGVNLTFNHHKNECAHTPPPSCSTILPCLQADRRKNEKIKYTETFTMQGKEGPWSHPHAHPGKI